jgi:hypothetical protein
MQGSMTTKSRSVRVGCLAAAWLALLAAAPAAALAGPLLSGYGGPGQGNQAILGSTLLGGPGGGSNGSGGPTSASGESAAASAAALAAGSSSAAGSAGGSGRPASSGHARNGALTSASSRAAQAAALKPVSYPAVEPTAASTPTLGLSGTDVFYIVLAALALAFTGVMTRHILRTGPAKGH